MNTLDLNDSMADYLRLANLRSLTGKNLRGRADRQFEEMQNPDLAGTASIAPDLPEAPSIPGSFDVRANLKIEPPPIEQGPAANDGGIWSKLANGFRAIGEGRLPEQEEEPLSQAMAAPAPKNLTQRVPEQRAPSPNSPLNSIPPTSEAGFNPFLGLLGSHASQLSTSEFNPALGLVGSALRKKEAVEMPYEINPTESISVPPPLPQEEFIPPENEATNQIPFEPGTQAQPGAIREVMEDPTLKTLIDERFGYVDPKMLDAVESYEKVINAYTNKLDDVTAALSDQESKIKKRIEDRNLTNTDKIMMALALIAPAIIYGLVGGKEAALGALGGGAKSFVDVLKDRKKEEKEDEEAITQIALDKAKVAKEKTNLGPLTQEFKQKIADSIPNKDLRAIFEKDGDVLNDKLVINSGNPNLPIKGEAIRDLADYKRIKKELPKFSKTLAYTEQASSIIDSMHSLLDAANASKDNIFNYIPFYDSVTGAVKAFIPYTRDTVKDAQGKEYKIADLYNTLRTQLADVWRNGQTSNANAFKATEEHFKQQLPDPFSRGSFFEGKSSIDQNKKQLDLVKNKFEDNILTYLDEQGIDVTPIIQKLKSSGRNVQISEQERKRKRAEDAANQVIRGK